MPQIQLRLCIDMNGRGMIRDYIEVGITLNGDGPRLIPALAAGRARGSPRLHREFACTGHAATKLRRERFLGIERCPDGRRAYGLSRAYSPALMAERLAASSLGPSLVIGRASAQTSERPKRANHPRCRKDCGPSDCGIDGPEMRGRRRRPISGQRRVSASNRRMCRNSLWTPE